MLGRAEPNFPFLRCSLQNSNQSDRGSELLDWTHGKHRIGRETHAVLVSSVVPRGSKYAMAHCMFVLDGASIPSKIEKTSPSLTSVQHFEIEMNQTKGGLQSRPKPRLVTSDARKLGARLSDFRELLCKICSIYEWRDSPLSADGILQSEHPFAHQVYAGQRRDTWGLPVQRSIPVIRKAWTSYGMDRVVSLLEYVVKHGSREDLQHGTKKGETKQAKSTSSTEFYRRPDIIIRTDFGDGVPPVGGEEKSRKRPYVSAIGEST